MYLFVSMLSFKSMRHSRKFQLSIQFRLIRKLINETSAANQGPELLHLWGKKKLYSFVFPPFLLVSSSSWFNSGSRRRHLIISIRFISMIFMFWFQNVLNSLNVKRYRGNRFRGFLVSVPTANPFLLCS